MRELLSEQESRERKREVIGRTGAEREERWEESRGRRVRTSAVAQALEEILHLSKRNWSSWKGKG